MFIMKQPVKLASSTKYRLALILMFAVFFLKVVWFVVDINEQKQERIKSISPRLHSIRVSHEELFDTRYLKREKAGYRVIIVSLKDRNATTPTNLQADDYFVTFDMAAAVPATKCGLQLKNNYLIEDGCKLRKYDLSGNPVNHKGVSLRKLSYVVGHDGGIEIIVGN